MRTSRLMLLILRFVLLLAILTGLGWHTHPTAAQPPTCQVTTLASEVTYDAPQISGNHVLWTNSADDTISLYSIDTGETVTLNDEGEAISPQLSGNYVLMPTAGNVRLYDIAARSETVILEDFGEPLRGLTCFDEAQCGNTYVYVTYQLVDPIILVYGLYEGSSQPVDIFVYDIATEVLDPLPAHNTGFASIVTNGRTVAWIELQIEDESVMGDPDATIWRYDVASKTAAPVATEPSAFRIALYESHIGWMYISNTSGGASSGVPSVDVYDMRDGSTRTLPVSPIGSDYLILTGDYAMWGTGNYTSPNLFEVYDLRHDVFFTIEANGDSSGTFAEPTPSVSSHVIVWDVAYFDSEGYLLTTKVFYYDLANRTQIALTNTAFNDESPSISANYVVWSGDNNDWEHPYLKDDVYLAVCETNLMVNGTFEANEDDTAKLPDGWQGVGALKGDRELTDKPQKTLAYSPPHAFQFKGFPGERSRIISKADLRGHDLAQGDTLTLSAMVDQRSGVPDVQIVKATVRYADGKQQLYRLRLPKLKIAGYVPVSVSRPLKFANVKQIKVEVFYQKATGKFIIDDVKLVLTKAENTPGLIPVPDAP